MSLQVILEKIRASGEAQVAEVENNAQTQVNEILASARAEASQIEEEARATVLVPATRERARILHHAHLEALHSLGKVQEELVDAAIAQTRERLAAIHADSAYPAVLAALTSEALVELASPGVDGKAHLRAAPRDRELLVQILDGLQLTLPVDYDLNCWGGVIAQSADGRVVAINTLESRLERASAFLRRSLAALFEAERDA